MKTEEAHGWGLRVGGGRPYLGYEFEVNKANIPCNATYYRPMKCVLVPLREWKRLKRIERKEGQR